MYDELVHSIVRQRARAHVAEERLEVNYYRVRRRVSYPLPIRAICLPDLPVRTLRDYPWATWMLWALEERISALGWAAAWFYEEHAYQETVERDLEALAGWPRFDQYGYPDLALGHSLRTLVRAQRDWPWLSPHVHEVARAACARAAEQYREWIDTQRDGLQTANDILARPNRERIVANIPMIGTLALAMAARLAGHEIAARLDRHALALVEALFELRRAGHTEGVAYDGYVLDFVADWLRDADPAAQRRVLSNPQLISTLDQSILLAAPGQPMDVAPIGDVEPREMPFHASAHAKLANLRSLPRSVVYLYRCPLEWLRSDALAALFQLGDSNPREQGRVHALNAGALESQYALVLRSGWHDGDAAVIMAASSCAMTHLHRDNGTIVIGTARHWLIDDPGYQQYMESAEREFTVGRTAHNAPVINGHAQTERRADRLACGQITPDAWHAAADITGCYDPALGLKSVRRYAWLLGRKLVIVADRIEGESLAEVEYFWHGHPDAAWWVDQGAAIIHLGGTALWIWCSRTPLAERQIDRLPGSRGQLTACVRLPAERELTVWWMFGIGERPPEPAFEDDGRTMNVADRRLTIEG